MPGWDVVCEEYEEMIVGIVDRVYHHDEGVVVGHLMDVLKG